MKFPLSLCLLLMVAALSGCGSRGQLAGTSANRLAQIKEFTQVVVLDFQPNDKRPVRDPHAQSARDKNINEGRIQFSDRIAQRITESKSFEVVSRKPLTGKFLVVAGTIDMWEPGNVATRALTGFIGRSGFASTITVHDGETGEELARINGDRNSWPLPIGASTTIVQTVDYFMNEAASHVATQLAVAKIAAP